MNEPHSGDGDRQALIGAAWRVLERAGFEGFKVQRVMREAGVSARTFYRHFPDKDELLVELMRDEMARAGALLRAAVAAADDPVEQVRAWVGVIIGAAADPRRVARARLFSAQQPLFRRFPGQLAEGTQLLVAPLREAIARGVATGVFPWAEPDRDAALIAVLAGGEMVQSLAQVDAPDVEGVVARTTAFVVRALGVPPAD
jgi:AcrR family transcriptional regulator